MANYDDIFNASQSVEIPSIVRFRLVCFFTLAIVDKSCVIPFAGGYCAMITLSAAAKALSVIIPRDGIQSISF